MWRLGMRTGCRGKQEQGGNCSLMHCNYLPLKALLSPPLLSTRCFCQKTHVRVQSHKFCSSRTSCYKHAARRKWSLLKHRCALIQWFSNLFTSKNCELTQIKPQRHTLFEKTWKYETPDQNTAFYIFPTSVLHVRGSVEWKQTCFNTTNSISNNKTDAYS